MLSLPPPPRTPTQPPETPTPTPSQYQTPLHQIILPKPPLIRQQTLAPYTPNLDSIKQTKPPILRPPKPLRTNPFIWCGAILCLIFSLILIFFGIATLIIFLSIKPKNPFFDTPNATLNTLYFDSTEYFNGDFTFLANFSNPNHKIDVRFEQLDIELYYFDKLIATQALQPFSQRRGETRLESVHLISSLVFLPQNYGVELRNQVENNRVKYNIRGTFKVKASLGSIHYSYWLHGRCQLEMTGPPTGVLVARTCKTKR